MKSILPAGGFKLKLIERYQFAFSNYSTAKDPSRGADPTVKDPTRPARGAKIHYTNDIACRSMADISNPMEAPATPHPIPYDFLILSLPSLHMIRFLMVSSLSAYAENLILESFLKFGQQP